MPSRFAIPAAGLFLLALQVADLAPLAAQQPLRALLPDAAVVALEVPEPRTASARLLDFLGPVPADLPDEVRALLAVGLTAARVMLGGSPDELLADLAPDGLVAAIAPGAAAGERQPLLLVASRVRDEARARARLEKLSQGKVSGRVQDGHLLLASSKRGLELLAKRLGSTGGRWAEWPDAGCGGAGALVRAWVDLDGLRAAVPGATGFAARLPAGARFLLGPLAAGVESGHRVSVWLSASEALLRLHAEVDGGTKGSPFAELLAASGEKRTLPAPPRGTGMCLSIDRSLHALLATPERYLPEAGVAAVRGFLSVADQLDGRTSFVDDLVGALHEPVHTWLRMPETVPTPAEVPLLLPELGFVARVRDKKAEAILSRMMQVLVLITNAERGQRNQFPFDCREVREADYRGLCAEAVPWRGPGAMPAEAAISPTLLFGNGHAILASTRAMAEALLASIRSGQTVACKGDLVDLPLRPWREWLERNRGPLEISRMFDEGETAAESRRFFSALAAVLGAFDKLELRAEPLPDRVTIEVDLRRARL